jgi:uncharacterized protein YndB with AHSA1/START domain
MKTCNLTFIRAIDAAPDAVYDAWLDRTSPGSPWFGSKRVIMNAAAGGLFYHTVDHEGKAWAHFGRFIELERGKRIEHTWMSEATQGIETIVTVVLNPRDGMTDVTLTHAGVPDDVLGRQHQLGWTWVLQSLADTFADRLRNGEK